MKQQKYLWKKLMFRGILYFNDFFLIIKLAEGWFGILINIKYY